MNATVSPKDGEKLETVEASNPLLGSLKISSSNAGLILTGGTFLLVAILAYILNAHAGDAKDTGQAVARELKEANKEVAAALKESNKEVAKVLSDLARAMREANCLARFSTPEQKRQNAEFCKSVSQ